MNQRYIITGAPGTGKTSIINELKNRGFNCINENVREIISDEKIIVEGIANYKNQVDFERKIVNLRIQQYLSTSKDHIFFFDRSAFDSIAYLDLKNLQFTSEIITDIRKCSFNRTVFYTPIWEEIYINDNERKESVEQAIKIEKFLIKTYESENYRLVKVPKLPIKKRADFIISKI
tara:strand:- start:561 stop:1088 length:528 start_codon:yes stop_codon:yes gene_type:complete